MRLGISTFSFFVAAALCAAPVLAQNNNNSHSSGVAVHSSASTVHGGTFSSGNHGAMATPTPKPQHGNNNGLRPRPLGYGYGYVYPYGTPYYIQSDNEYDQLPGHGTFDTGEADNNSPDNRVGPTIFEHNGAARSDRGGTVIAHENQTSDSDSDDNAQREAVLIFRDGHQLEVSNYATTPNNVIVIGEHSQKIALSDLDLDATRKANAERGVEFKTPAQS